MKILAFRKVGGLGGREMGKKSILNFAFYFFTYFFGNLCPPVFCPPNFSKAWILHPLGKKKRGAREIKKISAPCIFYAPWF
jgi:hypothetical protein